MFYLCMCVIHRYFHVIELFSFNIAHACFGFVFVFIATHCEHVL